MDFAACLLAQAADAPSGDSWLQAVTAISSVGFTLWFSWHTTTKTIPDLVKDLREKDVQHQAAVKEITSEFRSSLRQVTEHCEAELAQIAANYIRETDRVISEIRESGACRPGETR